MTSLNDCMGFRRLPSYLYRLIGPSNKRLSGVQRRSFHSARFCRGAVQNCCSTRHTSNSDWQTPPNNAPPSAILSDPENEPVGPLSSNSLRLNSKSTFAQRKTTPKQRPNFKERQSYFPGQPSGNLLCASACRRPQSAGACTIRELQNSGCYGDWQQTLMPCCRGATHDSNRS